MLKGSVALVTCAAHPRLSADDRLLLPALAAAGLQPLARRWDDPEERWERHAAVVLRSSWDYHLRAGEFHGWLDRLAAAGATVFNPIPTLRWNAEKGYLRDLEAAGIAVVPTAWVTCGAAITLAELKEARGWRDVVVKPTVSATAYETWRVGPAVTAEDERRFARLVGRGSAMVQPFVESIADGELSFVFLGGRFSHAVLKRPRAGDFRVQFDFGGTAEPAAPDPELIAQAERAVAAAPGTALYARVDGCVVDGGLQLMELELIEPALFFDVERPAPRRFVQALQEVIGAG